MTAYEVCTEEYLQRFLNIDILLNNNKATKSFVYSSESFIFRIWDTGDDSALSRLYFPLFGVYSLSNEEVSLYYLEEEFHNPLSPTKSECILFEIEHGFKYPLLEFLKEEPQ